MKVILLALLAALALGAGPLCAQDAAEPAAATPKPAAPLMMPPVKPAPAGNGAAMLTVYLVLFLGLFAGGVYVVRNGFTFFQPKIKGARKLQISEMRMLGNRQFLVVAEYEDRKLLLGVCPGRIDYLTNLGTAEPEFPSIGPEKSDG